MLLQFPIPKLLPDGSRWREVIDAKDILSARSILDAAKIAREIVDTKMREKPSINCVDIEDTICYKLGIIRGLDLILSLPDATKQALDEIEKRQ
jgi:hypothetical protein